MDEQKNNSLTSWDDSVYGTGSTQPPKNHSSLLTVMLILVIFLSGVVFVLSVLNIQMFQKLRQRQEDLSISFAAEPSEPSAVQPTLPEHPALPEREAPDIDLQEAPQLPEQPVDDGALPLQEIYAQNIPSVVSVIVSSRSGSSTGTGVILSENGYIVTNNHVVEGASQIQVLLTDQRSFTAGLVGSDSVSDLAVLFVEAEDLIPARFGDSDALRVGDSVVAIGDPLGVKFRGTMTDGIISAINRDISVNGRPLSLIQTNAALNSGNSGGPLINSFGQVIGINTMKISAFTDDAGVEGLGFAIPSAVVKDVVHQIISQGYVSGRPYLGIQGDALSGLYQHFYRLPAGLYITQVDSGSPAAAAGILPGDILLSIDDSRITSADSLNGALYHRQVGDTVTLTIYRKGYQATVDITLAEARS